MARVCFTPNCKERSNGTKPPYYAVPPGSEPAGKKVRDAKNRVIPHLVGPQYVADARNATHVLYTWNGGRRVRELKVGQVVVVTDGEVRYLESHYPGLVERMPDEELHADTVGALLEEKNDAMKERDAAVGELAEAREQVDKQSIALTQSNAEKTALQQEVERLQNELARAKAGVDKPEKKSAKADK